MINKREVGAKKEELARKLLSLNGYQVVTSNYRCHIGEIDIIALKDEYLCFVEVKYRSTLVKGSPLEAVDKKKQETISRVADNYRITKGVSFLKPIRFDVVAILDDRFKIVTDAFKYIPEEKKTWKGKKYRYFK